MARSIASDLRDAVKHGGATNELVLEAAEALETQKRAIEELTTERDGARAVVAGLHGNLGHHRLAGRILGALHSFGPRFRESSGGELADHIAHELRSRVSDSPDVFRDIKSQARAEALREAIIAHRNLHPTYGSTAVCGGGVGGQMMTQHCAVTCDNPEHDEAKQAWRAVEKSYFDETD